MSLEIASSLTMTPPGFRLSSSQLTSIRAISHPTHTPDLRNPPSPPFVADEPLLQSRLQCRIKSGWGRCVGILDPEFPAILQNAGPHGLTVYHAAGATRSAKLFFSSLGEGGTCPSFATPPSTPEPRVFRKLVPCLWSRRAVFDFSPSGIVECAVGIRMCM